nr:hypothetical protein [Solirubrobacterales bacterium]
MKSRLAMMAMLVSGLLLSGTGATLAVTDSTDNAAKSQYPEVLVAPTESKAVPVAPPTGAVLPAGPTSGGEGAPKSADTAPATKPAPEAQEAAPATREQ